jgi:hypothetical protein
LEFFMSENQQSIERQQVRGQEALGAQGLADVETVADALSLIGGLTEKQGAAFEVLTSGGSIAGAARAAGVTRRTMYAWLEEGRALAEAYAQWKRSIAEMSRTRLLMIGEAATMQIARAVKQGDTRTALAVAKGMGLLSPPAVGPSIHESTGRKRAAEAARAEALRAEALRATPFAELVDVERLAEEIEEAEESEGGGEDLREEDGVDEGKCNDK